MGWRCNIEWNDFAGTADRSGFLIQKHLLSRLMTCAGLLLCLKSLAQLGVFLLELTYLRGFVLGS